MSIKEALDNYVLVSIQNVNAINFDNTCMNKEQAQLRRKQLVSFLKDFAESGSFSNSRIANATDFKRENVNRMLNRSHAPSIDNLLRLASAMDIQIQVSYSSNDVQEMRPLQKALLDSINNKLQI